MPRSSGSYREDDYDPMSLDGVNPREYVSREEGAYWQETYGDKLIHIASARSGYTRSLCGRPRESTLKPWAVVTCVVCADLKKKAA